MKRILVLGGGFGGVSAAHHLRGIADQSDEIVLIDRQPSFAMGFHKNAIVAGIEPPGTGDRPLAALERLGIIVRLGTIEGLDAENRSVRVDGETIQADAILVALGAELAPGVIPGFAEYAINIFSSAGAQQAARELAERDVGRVVIGVFGAPYKCPPAPFELALLLHDAASGRGAQFAISVLSPLPMSIPALGPAGCNPLEARLAEQGIEFRPSARASAVEAGRVVLDGGAVPFDILLGIPPHRCPRLCVDAGLAPDGGWIKVDPATLATRYEGVWAVGDSTVIPLSNGQALPKSGVIADGEARVAAEQIAAFLAGRQTDAVFDGAGECALEVGRGEAMIVRGRFFEDPPQVELTQPSAEHRAHKDAYERGRLDAWFGPSANGPGEWPRRLSPEIESGIESGIEPGIDRGPEWEGKHH